MFDNDKYFYYQKDHYFIYLGNYDLQLNAYEFGNLVMQVQMHIGNNNTMISLEYRNNIQLTFSYVLNKLYNQIFDGCLLSCLPQKMVDAYNYYCDFTYTLKEIGSEYCSTLYF